MNLPIENCIENAKNRPWEVHKYSSKAAQDENLPMLIDWISQYSNREDTFSLGTHKNLFAQFSAKKILITNNQT